MKWIKPERVAHALHNLSEWRKAVKDQGSTHILPLLALLEQGAGSKKPIIFKETPDEFAFWDRYFRIHDADQEKPYFSPLTLTRREVGFPHSNSATIRKNTFDLKWHAASRSSTADGDQWTLADDYADIVRDKVLQKSGKITRVPLLDLAAILLRDQSFADDAVSTDIERLFRERFAQDDYAYQKLFEFRSEDDEAIFDASSDKPNYDEVIVSALIQTVEEATLAVENTAPATLDKIDDPDDSIMLQVRELLALGTSGLILKGPPGTGKTYYAQRIAVTLVDDPRLDVYRVQFHPSYGYEDFVEGYRPDGDSTSGFKIVDKIFIDACERARARPEQMVVFIVDEINRGEPARVFGELLTYIEASYRERDFILPFSGRPFNIPRNLLLIGTMNPHDRSVNYVDAAFVRRFDHISIEPSREVAERLLEKSGKFTSAHVSLIGAWFERAQEMVPFGLGHSFFEKAQDIDALKLVWRYRLKPTADTAIDLNEGMRDGFEKSFEALLRRLEGAEDGG